MPDWPRSYCGARPSARQDPASRLRCPRTSRLRPCRRDRAGQDIRRGGFALILPLTATPWCTAASGADAGCLPLLHVLVASRRARGGGACERGSVTAPIVGSVDREAKCRRRQVSAQPLPCRSAAGGRLRGVGGITGSGRTREQPARRHPDDSRRAQRQAAQDAAHAGRARRPLFACRVQRRQASRPRPGTTI